MNDFIIEIRKATISDCNELLDIYSYYVKNTAISFEYDVPTKEEFAGRINNISKKYPYLVAIHNDKIVGYAYANTFKNRKAYDFSVETTIYIDKDFHHFGIGRKLYTELEKELKEKNIRNMYACIAYTEKENEYLTNASKKFHEAMGFNLVGTFHKTGLKFNQWFDMIWMEKFIFDNKENTQE